MLRRRPGTIASSAPVTVPVLQRTVHCVHAAPRPGHGASSRLLLFRLAHVERHRRFHQRLERLLVDLVALMDIDGAALIAVEARIEYAVRVEQRGAIGESE